MSKLRKKFKWLQLLSKKRLEAREMKRLASDIFYPDHFVEPDIWYKITIENHLGEKQIVRLLNRPNERNDSYFVEHQGDRIYFNRFGKLVRNQTRIPLILGISDAMRFFAKQFPKIQGG